MVPIRSFPYIQKRKRRSAPPAPPPPLTLVSANFLPAFGGRTTLVFNRAIDIAAIDVTAFTVIDAAHSKHYRGHGTAALTDDVTLLIPMLFFASIIASSSTMTATSANGIVAVGEVDAWEGVTNLGLPFP